MTEYHKKTVVEKLTKDELGILYPIYIEEYNEDWPVQFEKEKQNLLTVLGRYVILRIDHIGSTAVPGLAAKPTIDILIEIPENINPDFIISSMIKHKYIHMTDQKRHLMFVKGYTPAGLAEESFHVHMGPGNQAWLRDRLYFRDYLRMNETEAAAYEKLKRHLAEIHKHDREAYTDNKTEYITRVTQIAREKQDGKMAKGTE